MKYGSQLYDLSDYMKWVTYEELRVLKIEGIDYEYEKLLNEQNILNDIEESHF